MYALIVRLSMLTVACGFVPTESTVLFRSVSAIESDPGFLTLQDPTQAFASTTKDFSIANDSQDFGWRNCVLVISIAPGTAVVDFSTLYCSPRTLREQEVLVHFRQTWRFDCAWRAQSMNLATLERVNKYYVFCSVGPHFDPMRFRRNAKAWHSRLKRVVRVMRGETPRSVPVEVSTPSAEDVHNGLRDIQAHAAPAMRRSDGWRAFCDRMISEFTDDASSDDDWSE